MKLSDIETQLDVILLAAGESRRMAGADKVAMMLGPKPVLCHSLDTLETCDSVRNVVVVVHPARVAEIESMIKAYRYSKVLKLVAGGERRQDSVKAGIDALTAATETAEFVAVHDVARPFIDHEMLRTGIDTARRAGAATPVVPIKDTVKRVENGLVADTLPRDSLRFAQTPQVFRMDVLKAAHEAVSEDVTDDASMVERAGGLVATFHGSARNIKITTPNDIAIANAIAGIGHTETDLSPQYRYGIGFDTHRLVPDGPLRLGGIDIEFDMHLKGHSDGDVLIHAVASAILGAAAMGDLGSNFPSSDTRYAAIQSAYFLRAAKDKASQAGWTIDFIDATVIAERPRLADKRTEMQTAIADALGLDQTAVNIKVTSTDAVGAIGRGEGIAAQAIATIHSLPSPNG